MVNETSLCNPSTVQKLIMVGASTGLGEGTHKPCHWLGSDDGLLAVTVLTIHSLDGHHLRIDKRSNQTKRDSV